MAVLVRHDVDRPAWASSASSESGSLELLLTLDALVGAAILRRTNGCSSTARARSDPSPRCGQWHGDMPRACHSRGAGQLRRATGRGQLHPRSRILSTAPRTNASCRTSSKQLVGVTCDS